MLAKLRRHSAFLAAVTLLTSGCSVLDNINLGSTGMRYNPTKVYLKDEFVTIRKREDMDRFVCLSGPLQCDGFGQVWDCSCF